MEILATKLKTGDKVYDTEYKQSLFEVISVSEEEIEMKLISTKEETISYLPEPNGNYKFSIEGNYEQFWYK